MFDLIASVLAWFYGLVHSYGLSIVLLTLVVMAIVTPFTIKGTKSMLQMQRLQPQLKAIQNRYRDDREKMNQELLKFYKENNINPVGGCLPMVIQIPVFIVLFRVLRGLTQRLTEVGTQAGLSAMNLHTNAPGFASAPSQKRTFNPSYLSHDSELYKSLTNATQMKSWGVDLAESASSAVTHSVTHALPYLALIALVAVTGIIQQRQIQGRQATSATPINPQQQMIMKIMPFFLPVFSFGLPAGLVVYFVVSNAWRIGQQWFITKTLFANGAAQAPIEVPVIDEAPVKSTPSREPSTKNPRAVEAAAPARSPMGRNRRVADGQTDRKPAPPRRKPPAKKTEPAAPARPSGRVTPPGSRSRKKKRT
jgi:YidC/Oxa1 family membrane protein insertase